MGFPRIPFLDIFFTKMGFFYGGPVTYILGTHDNRLLLFEACYLPLLRFAPIFWFLEFPSLTFRLRMETPKTQFGMKTHPFFIKVTGPPPTS